MLFNVLKEDYTVEFRNYGTIEIPKGTMVDCQSGEDPDINYFPVCEFDWLEKGYPEQSRTMMADAIEYGILIPRDKLTKALRLRFVYDDSGNCRDIYKAVNREIRCCRMESRREDKVEWFTVTPDWEEPDCPLRTDILIQIVDRDGKAILSEQQEKTPDGSVSDKTFPFSWEKPQATQQEELMRHLIYGDNI